MTTFSVQSWAAFKPFVVGNDLPGSSCARKRICLEDVFLTNMAASSLLGTCSGWQAQACFYSHGAAAR